MILPMMIRDAVPLREGGEMGLSSGAEAGAVSSLFDVEFDAAVEAVSVYSLGKNAESAPVETGTDEFSISSEEPRLASSRDKSVGSGGVDLMKTSPPVGDLNDQGASLGMVSSITQQVPGRDVVSQGNGPFQTEVLVSNGEYRGRLGFRPNSNEPDFRAIPVVMAKDHVNGQLRVQANPTRSVTAEGRLEEFLLQAQSKDPNPKVDSPPAGGVKTETRHRLEKVAELAGDLGKPTIPLQLAAAGKTTRDTLLTGRTDAALESGHSQLTGGPAVNSTGESDRVSSPNERTDIQRNLGLFTPEKGLIVTAPPLQKVGKADFDFRIAALSSGTEVSSRKSLENDIWVSITPSGNQSTAPQVETRPFVSYIAAPVISYRMRNVPEPSSGSPQQNEGNKLDVVARKEIPITTEFVLKPSHGAPPSKSLSLAADVSTHNFLNFNKQEHGEFGAVIAETDADIDLSATRVNRSIDLVTVRSEPPRPVAYQLIEAVRTTSSGTIELKLSPEELGRVKLSLTPSEAGLAVTILADRPETLDLIRRNIEIFAQDLRQQGHQNLTFQFGQNGSQGRNETKPGEPPEMNEKTNFEQAPYQTSLPPLRPVLNGRLDLRI